MSNSECKTSIKETLGEFYFQVAIKPFKKDRKEWLDGNKEIDPLIDNLVDKLISNCGNINYGFIVDKWMIIADCSTMSSMVPLTVCNGIKSEIQKKDKDNKSKVKEILKLTWKNKSFSDKVLSGYNITFERLLLSLAYLFDNPDIKISENTKVKLLKKYKKEALCLGLEGINSVKIISKKESDKDIRLYIKLMIIYFFDKEMFTAFDQICSNYLHSLTNRRVIIQPLKGEIDVDRMIRVHKAYLKNKELIKDISGIDQLKNIDVDYLIDHAIIKTTGKPTNVNISDSELNNLTQYFQTKH